MQKRDRGYDGIEIGNSCGVTDFVVTRNEQVIEWCFDTQQTDKKYVLAAYNYISIGKNNLRPLCYQPN